LIAACEKLYQAVASHYEIEPTKKPDDAKPIMPCEQPSSELPAQSATLQQLSEQNIPQPEANAGDVPVGQRVFTLEERTQRAAAYLAQMPPSISGQGGHNALYAAATSVVHGFLLPIDVAKDVILRVFNPMCQPPWSNKEIDHKLADAANKPHDKPAGWLLQDDARDAANLAYAKPLLDKLLPMEQHKQTKAPMPDRGQQTLGRIVYKTWTAAQLMTEKFELRYLVDGVLVAGQPCIVGGPKKAFKTSLVIDLGISLATGGYFLGKFKVPQAVSVGLMTGESGMATIQNTIRRISKTAEVDPLTLDRLIVTDQIPRIEDPAHL
jgi:hypothetical protein